MKIGVCFFIESNLGGAATQADDLVTAAERLGHTACLLQFSTSPRSRNLWDYKRPGLPSHDLRIDRRGMKMQSPKLLMTKETVGEAVKWLNQFDLLIFVGGCPHITRDFSKLDFHTSFKAIYTETRCRKVMFFTDPFWQRLYPYCKDVIGSMDAVYAFAEAYRREVVSSGLCGDSTCGICDFGSIAALDKAQEMAGERRNRMVWPHQWRSWKNPDLMIRLAPYLNIQVDAFADGIEYHKLRRDCWEEFSRSVKYDHIKKQEPGPNGNVTVYGTVPQSSIITIFSSNRWMLDLTGMSARTGEALAKFMGNYQCVNMECMMLGCVNFKYENTIEPWSKIPRDCVVPMPLVTEPQELAKFINSKLGLPLYRGVAKRAKEWALEKFNPLKVFQQHFVDPFN